MTPARKKLTRPRRASEGSLAGAAGSCAALPCRGNSPPASTYLRQQGAEPVAPPAVPTVVPVASHCNADPGRGKDGWRRRSPSATRTFAVGTGALLFRAVSWPGRPLLVGAVPRANAVAV